MKKFTLILLLLFTSYSQLRQIEGEAKAAEYNKIWKKFTNKTITVKVDLRGNIYIQIDGNIAKPTAFVSLEDIPKLLESLKKFDSWSEKATTNNIEIEKLLGNFLFEYEGSFKPHGIKLTFQSTEKGKVTILVVDVVDYKNQLYTSKVYMKSNEIENLIKIIEKSPETLKILKENKNKSDMFD